MRYGIFCGKSYCKDTVMKKRFLSDKAFGVIFTLGLVVIAGIVSVMEIVPYGADTAALSVSSRVTRRVSQMDSFVAEVLHASTEDFVHFDKIPDDIVIYKYLNDTLPAWCNQFTEINDDISSKHVFARITNSPSLLFPPLARADENLTYMNMGPKWYLVRSVKGKGGVTVVSGVEIKNSIIEKHLRGKNGINRRLRLPPHYDIVPLNEDNGAAVTVEGRPVFKIARTSVAPVRQTMGNSMFSPLVYADGPVLSSLGVLLLLNTLLTVLLVMVYHFRFRSMRLLHIEDRRKRRRRIALYGAGVLALVATACVYITLTYKSLVLNSSILFNFYSGNILYSVIVLVSYMMLIMMTLFQLFSMKVVFLEFTGRKLNLRSNLWPLLFALVSAGYLCTANILYGYQKEEIKVWSWADRLSIERDLALEIQLLGVEDAIASDPIVSALSWTDNGDRSIRNRITETYLFRLSQNHETSVIVAKSGDMAADRLVRDVLDVSTRIADNSNFFYNESPDSRGGYYGLFFYPDNDGSLVRVFLRVANNRESDLYGYKSIFPRTAGLASTGIPAYYSYAKYIDGNIRNFRGDYPYPTLVSHIEQLKFHDNAHCFFRLRNYDHFCTKIGEREIIVISRPARKFTSLLTSFCFLFLLSFCIMFVSRRRFTLRRNDRNYLRTKINLLVLASLLITLAAMAIVSISFVQGRTERNMTRLMSSKLNMVRNLLEDKCRNARSFEDLRSSEYFETVSETARLVGTDITLYTPAGKVFSSTAPVLFENMIFGSRLNQDAYYNIKVLNQRYFINQEELARTDYYALYAPVLNEDGVMIAIVNCPYPRSDYDYSRDAIMHTFLIVCLFMLLSLLSVWVSSTFTENMFRKLLRLGRTMDSIDIHNFEEIEYQDKDEVSSLVEAYNKMVRELELSSRQLARAERDSAWSEMARQVAHEIKNSLTPIKLKVQKLMRLKAKGAEDWDAKFDETAKVILEQIDVLAETASGFSAIAKLYNEQATVVNLDVILSEQVLLFDNRDNIRITYVGLPEALVLAPQTQLVRVFVNLITNAIQAVEIRMREDEEAGRDVVAGKIWVSLRNGSKEDFYDIVVDDNGGGVAQENLQNLFVPNFTTKSSGTGLGLTICRNIGESCNGTISYKRSYALGGACFRVSLPKTSEPKGE